MNICPTCGHPYPDEDDIKMPYEISVSTNIPDDTVLFIDAVTGKVLGEIKNICIDSETT